MMAVDKKTKKKKLQGMGIAAVGGYLQAREKIIAIGSYMLVVWIEEVQWNSKCGWKSIE